jgi:hypothetical protein
MVKATRRGIVDSARYFVNGFDASQKKKQGLRGSQWVI